MRVAAFGGGENGDPKIETARAKGGRRIWGKKERGIGAELSRNEGGRAKYVHNGCRMTVWLRRGGGAEGAF